MSKPKKYKKKPFTAIVTTYEPSSKTKDEGFRVTDGTATLFVTWLPGFSMKDNSERAARMFCDTFKRTGRLSSHLLNSDIYLLDN